MLLKYMFLNRKTGIFDSKTPVSYCLPLETKEKGKNIMRKKLIIVMLMMLGIISMGRVCRNMTQTIHGYTPSFHLNKGNKVIYGEYGGQEQVWDVGKADANQVLLMSAIGLGDFPIYDASIATSCTLQPSSPNDFYLYCPKTLLYNELSNISLNAGETALTIDVPFLPTLKQIENGGTLGLTVSDREFKDDTIYWLEGSLNVHSYAAGHYGYRLWNTLMIGRTSSDRNLSIVPAFYDSGNTPFSPSNR